MKVNPTKLNIFLASQCKTAADLRPGISPQTLSKVKRGQDVRPDVVGRIARSLGVDVNDIMEG